MRTKPLLRSLALLSVFIPASVLLPFGAAQAMDAASADNFESAVIARLGFSKGFCAIPNSGNGQLVRAFLQKSGMKVHAMDAVQANVDATRLLIEQNNLISARFYGDKGSLSLMPYADRFADLIVMSNLTDADLASVPYAEIERALCPGGQGWIGCATGDGTKVTQTALQNWMNGAAKKYSTAAISTTQGVWAVISRRELPGVDTWPRRAHDAAGTRSSTDTVASFPWLPQARLKPYKINGNYGSVVASGGKMYMAFNTNGSAGAPNYLRAYNIYNGEMLWQRDLAGDGVDATQDFLTAAPWGVYLRLSGGTVQLDGNTGAAVTPQSPIPADVQGPGFSGTGYPFGCGPYTATAKIFLRQMFAFGYDRVKNQNINCKPYKTPCQTGVTVSNGLCIFPPNFCDCNFSPGTMLEAPAGSFAFDRSAAADGSDRIEKGPAWGQVEATVVPDARDWPAYRANNQRSGKSANNVPATAAAPRLMWNVQPANKYVTAATTLLYDYKEERGPTPPVAAGQYTYFGGTDGYVRCIDNASGVIKWSYATGGRISAAPAVAKGCVYAGSGDGYAYCLEAHTGRLVWRFRAAPVDRRFNLFGYLTSMWPVIGGVLVEGDKAYFCGGLQGEYGTHLYCVDASSGALVWQNNSCGTSYLPSGRVGFSPLGPMAVANGKLVANSVASPIGAFSMATGVQDPTPSQFAEFSSGYSFGWSNWGREIGVLNNKLMFVGGLWAFSDYRERTGYWQRNKVLWFHKIDGSGTVTYPQISLFQTAWTGPAWDSLDYFGTTTNSSNLIRTSIANVASAVDRGIGYSPAKVMNDSICTPSVQWTRPGIYINAMALSPSGLVAAYSKTNLDNYGNTPAPESVDWFVGLLNRGTGASIWEAPLPDIGAGLKGEPLVQGLAIDRNGNIIIVQRNGNVLCYGTGILSVAQRDRSAQVPEAAVQQGDPAIAMQTRRDEDRAAVPPDANGGGAIAETARFGAPAGKEEMLPDVRAVDASRGVPDNSDVITTTEGVRMHTIPPDVRRSMSPSTAADMHWVPQAPVFAVSSVKASSAGRGNDAKNTIDRDLRTRWAPSGAQEQWIVYDLGAMRTVSSATVLWYAPKDAQAAFIIALSGDGTAFTDADQGMFSGRGSQETLRTFMARDARYVKITIRGIKGAAPVSFLEVGIHGQAATSELGMK